MINWNDSINLADQEAKQIKWRQIKRQKVLVKLIASTRLHGWHGHLLSSPISAGSTSRRLLEIPSEIPKAHHTYMQWWGTLVPPCLARRSESNLNRWALPSLLSYWWEREKEETRARSLASPGGAKGAGARHARECSAKFPPSCCGLPLRSPRLLASLHGVGDV
jgi:hypothetical protein